MTSVRDTAPSCRSATRLPKDMVPVSTGVPVPLERERKLRERRRVADAVTDPRRSCGVDDRHVVDAPLERVAGLQVDLPEVRGAAIGKFAAGREAPQGA